MLVHHQLGQGGWRYGLWGRAESGKTLVGSFTTFSFIALSGLGFCLLALTISASWILIGLHIVLVAYLVSSLEFVS